MNSITPSPKEKTSSKNNLIQNFYVIGFSPEDFFKIDTSENKGEYANIFTDIENIPELCPKIITKFPNTINSINSIPDEIILDHCFPDGKIKVFKKSENEFPKKSFQFELDNIPQNYPNDEQKIYSKIYFSCLEFGESISQYFRYRREIYNLACEVINIVNYDKNAPGGIDVEKKFSDFMIPKILCFASVMPFYNELGILLEYIYDYFLSKTDFPPMALENIIEQIITKVPIPLKIDTEVNLEFKPFNEKIKFPICYINETNINYSANSSLLNIFKLFSLEDIIRIFKYFLFEIPLLFFSEEKSILSLFIDTFLTVLSPFKYVYPHISILPQKLYGLINSEQKFIFGINKNYDEKKDFFVENNIELDKTIVIIYTTIGEKGVKIGKIVEKIFDSNNKERLLIERNGLLNRYDDYIYINQINMPIINVDIPYCFKKYLLEGLSKYISFMKKKSFFSNKENIPKDLTIKIQNTFYSFFVHVMAGFTDYLLKSEKFYCKVKNVGEKIVENIGENVFFKNDYYFIKELFNYEEFSKTTKDCQAFYIIFFNTALFLNFLRERIYNNKNIIDQLALKQFEQLTYLKKHQDSRKRKENKAFYENFKKEIIEKIQPAKKDNILLCDDIPLSDNEKSLVTKEDNKATILIKYGQLYYLKDGKRDNQINKKKKVDNNDSNANDNVEIRTNYFIFPKLLFDFKIIKRNNLQFLNDDYLGNFILMCKQRIEEYKKVRPYVFSEKLLEGKIYTSNYKINYTIPQKMYIEYIWLILISCSLCYCEIDERNYRIKEIFEILNKKEYIEEYVLNILFINIYKYGEKYHLIKLYLFYCNTIKHINYYFLYLFCEKIKEKENEDINDNLILNEDEQNDDILLSKRCLIKSNDEFLKKRKKNQKTKSRSSIVLEDSEEIIFSSEQKCTECNEISNIVPKKIIEEQNDLNKDYNTFICPACKNENKFIIIKYQFILFNMSKKEGYMTQSGEFKHLTPYKIYRDLKKYLIEENNIELEIRNIFVIEDKINLINIFFYFCLYNLSFDFLLPYDIKLTSSMKLFFQNAKSQKDIKMEKKDSKPIKLDYKNEVFHRKFNNITPVLNPKKKNSSLKSFFGKFWSNNQKNEETDLSFTIKNTKKKGKK